MSLGENSLSKMLLEKDYEEQRQKYRNLIDDLQEKAENSGAQGLNSDTLRMYVLEGNALFDNVRRPREAALDAQFMKQVSQLANINIRSTHMSLHEFKPTEFQSKLKTYFNRRPDRPLHADDWRRLTKLSGKIIRECKGVEPQIINAEETEKKAPAQRIAREKDKEVAKTDLAKVAAAPTEEVQTEEVTRVYQILKRRFKDNGHRPVCLYSFVINPQSFGLTIENSFHTSFLIRDQHALIAEDSEGLPIIAPNKPSTGQSASKELNKQFALDFDLDTYKQCIDAFSISEPMIPPRPVRNGQ